MTQHKLVILHADSVYIRSGLRCPVSHRDLRPGEAVIVCQQPGKDDTIVSSLESLAYLGVTCPICGQHIDVPLPSIPGDANSEHPPAPKKSPYTPARRQPKSQGWAIPVLLTLLLVSIGLYAWVKANQTTPPQEISRSEELTITPLIVEMTKIVTPVPPTATLVPPTTTLVPPTATLIPPTA